MRTSTTVFATLLGKTFLPVVLFSMKTFSLRKIYCHFQINYNLPPAFCLSGFWLKRETRSYELNISSSSIIIPAMYVLISFELLTWYSVLQPRDYVRQSSSYFAAKRTCVVDYMYRSEEVSSRKHAYIILTPLNPTFI